MWPNCVARLTTRVLEEARERVWSLESSGKCSGNWACVCDTARGSIASCVTQVLCGFKSSIWVVVKIMVPFWVPIILRGLIRGLI